MKLIKINTDHYVIVDDSEIGIGERSLLIVDGFEPMILTHFKPVEEGYIGRKITHSTEPLELGNLAYRNIERLITKEVKELIGEVYVEDEAERSSELQEGTYTTQHKITYKHGYSDGYNQAIKNTEDKKYTEKDMWEIFIIGMGSVGIEELKLLTSQEVFVRHLKSLQPKTEWEVDFVDGKLSLK